MSHWSKISRPYLVPVPNYLTLTKYTPQKMWVFWLNPFEIEAMITFVPWQHVDYNFSPVIKVCWWRHWQKFWRHNLYFKISLFEEGIEQPFFAEIMKIATMFLKKIFEGWSKVKSNLYQHFLIKRSVLISSKEMLMSAEIKRSVTWVMYLI